MARPAVNEIEEQFAHLSHAEQLDLLERLVHQARVSTAGNDGLHNDSFVVNAAAPGISLELDAVRMDLRSSSADLLSETW